jgi:very-short-patch-repair endonuclease
MTTSLRTKRARELRKNQTEAEGVLWQRLRNKQLNGLKFRRQHPISGFIVDFYCFELKLAIELDGQVHIENDQREQDDYRANVLTDKGVTILRFWNSDVINRLEKVLETIEATAMRLRQIN